MEQYPDSINQLIKLFIKLPGFGPKSAERAVFYLIKQRPDYTHAIQSALHRLRDEVKICSVCHTVDTADPCRICSDTKREQRIICVVATPQDVLTIEKTGEYTGLYHVLGGVLNPVDNVTPDKLHIRSLLQRIQTNKPRFREVILATNPDLEGESTALYLHRQLKEMPVKVTRLAKGLPMGATIEYADDVTIASAMQGRRELP